MTTMEYAKLRSLVTLNLVWSGLLTLATVIFCGMWWFERSADPTTSVTVLATTDGARISTLYGGTTITHLATRSEPFKIARLREPLVSIDSSQFEIQQSDLTGLDWRDTKGEAIAPPPPGVPLHAVFVKAHFSRSTEPNADAVTP